MKIERHDIPLDLERMLEENREDFEETAAEIDRLQRLSGFGLYANSLAARLVCLDNFNDELCTALNTHARVVWAMCATVEAGGYEADFGVGKSRVLPRLNEGEIPTPRTFAPGFASAVLTYDSYIIENLAKHPTALMRPKTGMTDPMAFMYVEALQAYVLGDHERAYKCATETLATDATVNEDYSLSVLYPRAEMIARLIERDEAVFNERLRVTIEAHKKYFSAGDRVFDIDGHFPVELVAIATLAHDAGMKVSVESDYIPMELVRGLCKPSSTP